jgi:hypothetical protein
MGKGIAAKAQSADVAKNVTKGMTKLWGAVKYAGNLQQLKNTKLSRVYIERGQLPRCL